MKILLFLVSIASLSTGHTQTPAQFKALQAQVTSLQAQVNALLKNNALALGPYVTVDPNQQVGVRGPNITFHGANVHIVSGYGSTNDMVTGYGNLIIGYDEDPVTQGAPMTAGDRRGSHNLIIGRWHKWTQSAFGGFLGGELNTLMGEGQSILAGARNKVMATNAAIVGGIFNKVAGPSGVIVGGGNNIVDIAGQSVLLGGTSNYMTGQNSVLLGGQNVEDTNDYAVSQ